MGAAHVPPPLPGAGRPTARRTARAPCLSGGKAGAFRAHSNRALAPPPAWFLSSSPSRAITWAGPRASLRTQLCHVICFKKPISKSAYFLPWPNTTLKSGFSVTSRLTRSPSGLVSWTWGLGRPPAGGGQGGRGAVGPPRPYHARRRTPRRRKEAWGRGAGRAHAGGFSVGTCGVRGSAFAP